MEDEDGRESSAQDEEMKRELKLDEMGTIEADRKYYYGMVWLRGRAIYLPGATALAPPAIYTSSIPP